MENVKPIDKKSRFGKKVYNKGLFLHCVKCKTVNNLFETEQGTLCLKCRCIDLGYDWKEVSEDLRDQKRKGDLERRVATDAYRLKEKENLKAKIEDGSYLKELVEDIALVRKLVDDENKEISVLADRISKRKDTVWKVAKP